MEMSQKKILVRAPNWLGDNVLILPAVVRLQQLAPHSEITILVKAAFSEFWKLAGFKVIELPKFQGISGLIARYQFAKKIKTYNFDWAIIMPNSFDSAVIPFLATIKKRIGWATDARRFLLNHIIKHPNFSPQKQQPFDQLFLIEKLFDIQNFSEELPQVKLNISNELIQAAKEKFLIENEKIYIAINPGATYGTAKCWEKDYYVELILKAQRSLDLNVLIIGGNGDFEVCNAIMQDLLLLDPQAATWCKNMAGKTSITELATFLKMSQVLITNDTGAMHMAAVVETPIIAIFGPTNWNRTAPLGDKNVLLRGQHDCVKKCKRVCLGDHRCMKTVTVDVVYNKLEKITKNKEKK